jgi:hypothetical protein
MGYDFVHSMVVAWSQATKAQENTVHPESEKGVGLYLSILYYLLYLQNPLVLN